MTRKEHHGATPSRNSSLPRSLYRGPVRLGDVTLEGHVLDNEQRLFSLRSLSGALAEGSGPKNAHFERHLAVIENDSERLKVGPKIEFIAPGGVHHGYPVEALVAVCEAYVDGLIHGTLHAKQKPIAHRARALQRAWATIGLVALVDEGTGYQSARAADDLQRRLALYLLPTPGRWEVTFPPEFYRLVAKLYRVRLLHPSRRPQFFANFTREFVYAPAVGGDVSQALASRNPDPAHGHNHHQLLTGPARALLLEQRNRVMTLLRQSSTPEEFRARYRVEFHGAPLQLSFAN